MRALAPLEVLYEDRSGSGVPLPSWIARIYGRLAFPRPTARPYVVANFASTADGVVAFGPHAGGGGEITGHDAHDRLIMGMLRALSDSVVVGAGTLRSVPHHRWTAEEIFPAGAATFRALRSSLGKPPSPQNVIVTARGDLDLELPVFRTPGLSTVVVTTPAGARRLRTARPPADLRIEVPGRRTRVSAADVLAAVAGGAAPSRRVLVEGGPHLLGDFIGERLLDELFLTIAPQIGGRDGTPGRFGLVEGRVFGPKDPVWLKMRSARRHGGHLFLRYGLRRRPATRGGPGRVAGPRAPSGG